MTDNTQELDDILNAVTNFTYDAMAHRGDPLVGTLPTMDKATAKLAIIDWHNKQVEGIIKKPHILPKNAQHQESVKQGINFYHRQMRKRVDKLKEKL